MQAIQQWQMKTLYAVARSLGMDNEELHLLVAGLCGKESIKGLTSAEADSAIAELKERQKAAGIVIPRKHGRQQAAVPGGITKAQQSKVWALVGELEKLDAVPGGTDHRKRLCGIIKKELELDAAPSAPFRWVTMELGRQLIDALNRYVRHEQKHAGQRGERYG